MTPAWFEENTFWCAANMDTVACSGLLQARATLVVGVIVAFFLWRILAALKRRQGFEQTRHHEHRYAYAQILDRDLKTVGQKLENGEVVPLVGPFAHEEWHDRSVLPTKVQAELSKLIPLIAAHNSLLIKAAPKETIGAELSAVPTITTPRTSNDLKKQLAKCQKQVAALL